MLIVPFATNHTNAVEKNIAATISAYLCLYLSKRNLIANAARYDLLFKLLSRLSNLVIEWIAPVVVVGKLSRASTLGDSDFGKLVETTKTSSFIQLRGAMLLALSPILEVYSQKDAEVVATTYKHSAGKLLGKRVKKESKYDVLIIGSGAGGAPLAWELAKSGAKVAILEKGGIVSSDTGPNTTEKHFVLQGFSGSNLLNILPVYAGHAVGGTTPVNAGTSIRSPKAILDQWDKKHKTSFANGSLDKFFENAEKATDVGVVAEADLNPADKKFLDGLKIQNEEWKLLAKANTHSIDTDKVIDENSNLWPQRGVDMNLIPQAIKKGAHLFSGTTAKSINEKGSVVEVIAGRNGKEMLFRADKLVISAGAIYTPGLLKKNKLGSNYRNAGHNLKVHPAAEVMAYFPDLDFDGNGVIQGVGFDSPDIPSAMFETTWLPKNIFGLLLPFSGERFKFWMDNYNHLSTAGVMVKDINVGKVFEIGNYPVIHYLLDKDNAKDLVRGLVKLAEIYFAAGAERVMLPLLDQESEFSNTRELQNVDMGKVKPNSLYVGSFHPQGTAGIGRLVDNNLKLIGTDRIYVSDASVLPDSPGANPQLTIMALSLRLADHLKENGA